MKQKIDYDRKRVKDEAQPSSSHSLDAKFDNMMKKMQKIMERLAIGDRLAVTQQQDPQIRNPNFRKQQFPQIRQRNPNENEIRPPFQENIVTRDVEENDD